MKRRPSAYVAQAAMIAALYVALTLLSTLLALGEVRLSEALCVLPYLTPAAVPGLTVGCVLANLLTGCPLPDVIFGSLATYLGALWALRLCKRSSWLAPWPNALCNTVIIPLLLRYVYMDSSRAFGILVLYIGLGELISGVLLGYLLLHVLRPHAELFRL